MNARIISNRLVVPLVLVAAASCGRSSSLPAGGGRAGQFIDLTHAAGTTAQISLKSGVATVDRSATASALVAVSADRSTFLFEHPPAALTNLTSGSTVLFGGLGARKIVSLPARGEPARGHDATGASAGRDSGSGPEVGLSDRL